MLLRHVNESKRGVKNVLKSFWRRPRDNSSHQKGVARYRYDRIEAQILLLADAAFGMRVSSLFIALRMRVNRGRGLVGL
jgi:trafficking protein particle complex subunit 8